LFTVMIAMDESRLKTSTEAWMASTPLGD